MEDGDSCHGGEWEPTMALPHTSLVCQDPRRTFLIAPAGLAYERCWLDEVLSGGDVEDRAPIHSIPYLIPTFPSL